MVGVPIEAATLPGFAGRRIVEHRVGDVVAQYHAAVSPGVARAA
jgi:hypothetical protein